MPRFEIYLCQNVGRLIEIEAASAEEAEARIDRNEWSDADVTDMEVHTSEIYDVTELPAAPEASSKPKATEAPERISVTPWHWGYVGDGCGVFDAGGVRIALCHWWTEDDSNQDRQKAAYLAEANARMMAAAPELVDALNELLPYVVQEIDDRKSTDIAAYADLEEAAQNAIAALARATGGAA